MKIFLSALFCFLALATRSQQGKITVTVSGFTNDRGRCQACLFNQAGEFKEGGRALQCISTSIKERTAAFIFEKVTAGEYAILLFHDVNLNNKLDKNFLGIPREGYGASGNELPFASAPSFNANRFRVSNGNVSLKIRLRYL